MVDIAIQDLGKSGDPFILDLVKDVRKKPHEVITCLEIVARHESTEARDALEHLLGYLNDEAMRTSWGHIVRCLWRVRPEAAPIYTLIGHFLFLSSGGKRAAAKIFRNVGLPVDLQPRIGEIVRKIWSDAREDDRRPDHYLLGILEEIPFRTA